MNAEDLLAAVFPDQVACAENLPGEIEIPDHPLVRQTIADCLHEAMDATGWLAILRRIESGTLAVVARDLTEPSPLALEVLSARPYAFLDDAPLEERRTQAVMSRRWLDPDSAADIGRLDPKAIAKVREEAWPDARSADELHDALSWMGYLTAPEVAANPIWSALIGGLVADCQGGAVARSDRHHCGWRASGARSSMRGVDPRARRGAGGHPAQPSGGPGSGDADGTGGNAAAGTGTARWRRRCCGCRPRAWSCAAASPPAARSRSGANGACWRASIATPCAACAPRSSRWPRGISCASCSTGSA